MPKHFLDTSVVRPLISSSEKAKQYYDKNIGNDRYISDYVKMEYIRGFIIPLMEFYGKVVQPTSNGYSDALYLWQHQFQGRQIKAVISLAASIQKHFEENNDIGVKFNSDKKFQSQYLSDYIRRLLIKTDIFQNINLDKNLCYRMKFKLKYNPHNPIDSFIDFISLFKNIKNSKTCGLNNFLSKNKSQLNAIISYSVVKEPESITKIKVGIKKLYSGKISCVNCSKVGDAIICTQTPATFQLEHTDGSFDVLGSILNTVHRKHPAETKII